LARRYLAEHIPNARLVELPGADCYPFHTGDFNLVLDEIQEFLTGERSLAEPDRLLATILFTDIVESTRLANSMGDQPWSDLLAAHYELIQRDLGSFRGRLVATRGDGILATFDGPARAIRCAAKIVKEVQKLGLNIRVGMHTGEVEVRGEELSGIAIHIAARVIEHAGAGEVLVSRTVKDLVVGSGNAFASCGLYSLKGVPGDWELYRLVE
jgi:class 3 adenylate cyclase